jgi:O-antigen/teichoic acid export membrane protein
MRGAIAATSVAQIVVVALAFVTQVAQARILGAEGRGDLARFVNAGSLSVLYLGLGISSAITYFISSGTISSTSLQRQLRLYLAGLTVVALLAFTIVAISPLGRFLPQTMGTPMAVVALTTFFAVSQAGTWLAAILAGRADFSALNRSAVAVAIGLGVASVGLLLVSPPWAGPWTIIAFVIAAEAIRVAILAYYLRKRNGDDSSASGSTASSLRVGQLWRYSGMSYVGDALQFLTYRFDMWVVDAYRGGGELGQYALAVALVQLVWIVPTAIARVYFPYTAASRAADAIRMTRRAMSAALIVGLLTGAGAWVGSQWFLTTIIGDAFAPATGLISIMLLGVVPYSAAKVAGGYFAATNALRINVLAAGAVLVLTVALDLVLIPIHGAVGAAWATAVSYVAYTLILVAEFFRRARATREQERRSASDTRPSRSR